MDGVALALAREKSDEQCNVGFVGASLVNAGEELSRAQRPQDIRAQRGVNAGPIPYSHGKIGKVAVGRQNFRPVPGLQQSRCARQKQR
jgi:hypothetical protein